MYVCMYAYFHTIHRVYNIVAVKSTRVNYESKTTRQTTISLVPHIRPCFAPRVLSGRFANGRRRLRRVSTIYFIIRRHPGTHAVCPKN